MSHRFGGWSHEGVIYLTLSGSVVSIQVIGCEFGERWRQARGRDVQSPKFAPLRVGCRRGVSEARGYMLIFSAVEGIADLWPPRTEVGEVCGGARSAPYVRSRDRIKARICGLTHSLRHDDRTNLRKGVKVLNVSMSAPLNAFAATSALAVHGPRTSSRVVVVAMKVLAEEERGRWL